jgi:hypothetical protein
MRWSVIALLFVVVLSGCVPFTTRDGRAATLGTDTGERTLVAVVKGSVYETGEQVSVFGTCLDQYQSPVPGVYAEMSSWYPNGTKFFNGTLMSELQPGYFLYTGTMSAVRGTYLTEMRCRINGSVEEARAFGEWQNPYWVARLSNISQQASDLQVSIGDLRLNMSDSFEITWSMIQNLNTTILIENLSEQIAYVAMVANASVDRNDSYLASLLLQLLNETAGGAVVIDSVGLYADGQVLSPMYGVNCYLSNNNLPASVNSSLGFYTGVSSFSDPGSNNDGIVDSGVLSGGFFYKSEQIRRPPSEAFNWNVTCSVG